MYVDEPADVDELSAISENTCTKVLRCLSTDRFSVLPQVIFYSRPSNLLVRFCGARFLNLLRRSIGNALGNAKMPNAKILPKWTHN